MPAQRTKFSNRQFTQPQRLSVLCLIRYEDWTFCETEVRLSEHMELSSALELHSIPDDTTLYRFLARLDPADVARAMNEIVRRMLLLPQTGSMSDKLPAGDLLIVRKAIITAAARSQRELPLQTLIDGDGNKKSLLHILIEQSLAAGVEEIAVVVWPGDETSYAQAAGPHASSVRFIPQPEPRGYGHAIHCARSFTNSDPFLHMVGDHLYVSTTPKPSAQRLVELAQKERCSVSGVQATRESLLSRYGTVGGRRVPPRGDVYRVDTVIEKPTPTEAEQRLLVPGIRAGYYLCFFGIHVLTPTVMDILGRMLAVSSDRPVTLVDALSELARREQYLAIEDEGRRYDLGAPYGLLIAQLALALNGRDRNEVLSQLLELLADRELAGIGRGASS